MAPLHPHNHPQNGTLANRANSDDGSAVSGPSVKHYKRLPVRPIKSSYRQDERIILGQSQPHPTALTAAWKQPDPDPTFK